MGTPSPLLRILWPYLKTRIFCGFLGDLVLAKCTKLVDYPVFQINVRKVLPLLFLPSSHSPFLVRLTSLNHSIGINCKKLQSLRDHDSYLPVLVSRPWGQTWPHIFFSSLNIVHYSSATLESSLLFYVFFFLNSYYKTSWKR